MSISNEFARMKAQLEDIDVLLFDLFRMKKLYRTYSEYKEFYHAVKEIMEREQ